MPCAPVMRPMRTRSFPTFGTLYRHPIDAGVTDTGLALRSGSLGSLGCSIGGRFLALETLLLGLALVRIVARIALQQTCLVEEAQNAIGRLCTLLQPLAGLGRIELHALLIRLAEHRIESADDVDELAV